MTDKGKLETVLEDPELPTTPNKDTEKLSPAPNEHGKTPAKVIVDIQLPIITEVGPSGASSRESSATNIKTTEQSEANQGDEAKLKDENNNNRGAFLDKVSESLVPGEANDEIYQAFTRTDTILSKASSVRIPSPRRSSHSVRKTKSAPKQPRSKSSKGFTKKELELFLPRKTFFSAHDKELRDAGFQIDNSEQRKKPNWRAILRMHTMDELYPPDKEPEPVTPGFNVENESDDEEEGDANPLENVETAVGSIGLTSHPPKTRKSKKKSLSNEKEEYKPLYDYLKYIQEHPDEYKSMSKYTPKNNDHRHPSNMVRLGRAYRRWHHGTQKYSIYQHALNGLKVTPEAETRRGQVTRRDNVDGGDQTPVPDESEIEKLKSKTEKWLRTLTTQQILKYKELALKDVGDEDATISKWWVTFRSCHYIRLPHHLSS